MSKQFGRCKQSGVRRQHSKHDPAMQSRWLALLILLFGWSLPITSIQSWKFTKISSLTKHSGLKGTEVDLSYCLTVVIVSISIVFKTVKISPSEAIHFCKYYLLVLSHSRNSLLVSQLLLTRCRVGHCGTNYSSCGITNRILILISWCIKSNKISVCAHQHC